MALPGFPGRISLSGFGVSGVCGWSIFLLQRPDSELAPGLCERKMPWREGRWRAIDLRMNDQELFSQAIGVQPPWSVKEVRMDLEAQRVEVEVECAPTVWADPETKQRLHLHGYEQRRWRHLDTMQFETVIVAKVPRLKYPDGHTELLPIPWAEPHSRHSFF